MTEHGWNDPPVFSFSSLQSGANKKLQMNKRVNHLSSNLSDKSSLGESTTKEDSASTRPTVVATLNSVPSSSAPPPTSSSCLKDRKTQSDTINDDVCSGTKETDAREVNESRSFNTVLISLTELTERHCESVQKRIHEEIKRRLAILSKQWEEGILSTPVQTEMTKLTTALERGDCQTADRIHVSLMVDHTSEVNQWMVGVKRLIATMKAANQT